MQVGEGADELFYGYEHWLRYMRLNRFIKPVISKDIKSFSFKSHRGNLLSNVLLNRTSFAGGALGFNIPEINNLLMGGVSQEFPLVNYVDYKWKDYFSNKNAEPLPTGPDLAKIIYD